MDKLALPSDVVSATVVVSVSDVVTTIVVVSSVTANCKTMVDLKNNILKRKKIGINGISGFK